jgi:hypothetical protein
MRPLAKKALEAIQKREVKVVNTDLIEITLWEIDKGYRPGLIGWIEGSSDRWAVLLTLEDRINRAALLEDEIILRDALSEYRGFFEEMPRAKEATASARI